MPESQEGLPEELKGRRFDDTDDLQQVLDELGCGDTRFKLDENGCAVKPTPEHNRVCSLLRKKLDDWSKGMLGKWGISRSDNVQLVQYQSGSTRRREPDVAFWGYEKCTMNEYNDYVVKKRKGGEHDLDPHVEYDLDPYVVFQFSWRNKWNYEVAAINDLMQRGGVGYGN